MEAAEVAHRMATIASVSILVLSTSIASARAGDQHPARELPPNAVQPPGASFEKDVTGQQKVVLFTDCLRATVSLIVHRPLLASGMAVGRLGERIAVSLAELAPVGQNLTHEASPESGGPLTPARITPLFDSHPAYQALLRLIASSRSRIDLMIFGWDDDLAGRPVAEALIGRARAGVRIRVMVDRGGHVSGEGNARVARGGATFLDWLRVEPGVEVIEAPDPFFRFDHRKVAVIDDRIVWTGGMILTRPALTRWHNFAFLAEGAIVPQYAALFANRWAELGGRSALTAPQALETRGVVPNAQVRMIRTDVFERSLKDAVYGAVDSAKHHIYLENPYFDDTILMKKLIAARSRGVDVRAVLTKRGDVHLMNEINSNTANRLLRGGVRVYLYPAMTHVKALSVDGNLAYIGTGNFDALSLRNNREVALTVRGPELIRQIDANLFLRDIAASEELRALLPRPRKSLLLKLFQNWY